MQLFIIACHIDINGNIIGFRIKNTDSGEVIDCNYNKVRLDLQKGIKINGLKIKDNKIKGSNGVLSRYSKLYNNTLIGCNSFVIVKEYPNYMYDVCDYTGKIITMKENDIISFSQIEGLANGKIVNRARTLHISSISGEYNKDESFNCKRDTKELKGKMNLLGFNKYEINKANYAYTTRKDIDKVSIGQGCLGVAAYGFKNCINLQEVKLPKSSKYIGTSAFENCINLKFINIPEGILTIPRKCFYGCNKLESIVLPNSLKSIEEYAFSSCIALKSISLGPIKPRIHYSAFSDYTYCNFNTRKI